MEVEGFLLASGFALLIVLLGWASQITSKSKEAKQLEADFLSKAKLKRDDFKEMVDEGGTTEHSFITVVDFLFSAEEENVVIFDKIKRVKEGLYTLDKKYRWRFWLLLLMSAFLFLTGTVAFILPDCYKLWALAPNSIFVVMVFCNLITIHNLEKKYVRNISEAMEKL